VFKVIVSPRAWDDFFEIFDYISRDNRDAAERFCDALLNHVDLLGTFPHIGVVSAQRPNVRSVLHTPVRIYYRIDDSASALRSSISGIPPARTRRSNPQAPVTYYRSSNDEPEPNSLSL
jgi:plasmid stabilization system protein ParE